MKQITDDKEIQPIIKATEDFMRKKSIKFITYFDTEEETKASAKKITSFKKRTFPQYEVIETVESEKFKPPFAVSWQYFEK